MRVQAGDSESAGASPGSVYYGFALGLGEAAEERGQAGGQGAGAAGADGAAVHADDGGPFAHRAGAEFIVGAVQLGQREVAFGVGDRLPAAQLQHGGAVDAFGPFVALLMIA